jgi:hypothetical protein
MLKLLRWHSHNLLKFSAAVILIAVPLYPKFPLLQVPGTFVSIRLEDFLILAAALIWVLSIFPSWQKLASDSLNRAIFLFLGISLVSVISAWLLTRTVSIHIGFFHWARRVEYFLPFFIGCSALRSKKDLSFLIRCLFLVILWIALYGLGQKYFGWPVITTQNPEYARGVALTYLPGGHLVSTFAGHYDLATFLIFISPIFFCLLFSSKQKLLSLLIIAASIWLVINSVSRISIISFVLAVSVSLFLLKKYRFIPVVAILVLVLAGFSPSLIARYSRVIKVTVEKIMDVKQRILYDFSSVEVLAQSELPQRHTSPTPIPTPEPIFEDRSTSIRLKVEWPRALRAFHKNPLLGTGFSSITLATDNDYIRLLGETGILGFASFLLILFVLANKFLVRFPLSGRITTQSAYLAGVFGGFSGVLLNALFIDIFEASKFATIFWLIMGISISLLKLEKK